MQPDDRYKRSDDVKIPVPWSSTPASVPGRLIAGSLLTLCLAGGLAWMIRDSDIRQTEQMNKSTAERQEQMRVVIKTQQDIKKSMDSMVFLISISESERRKYHMEVPEQLRFKLVERGGE